MAANGEQKQTRASPFERQLIHDLTGAADARERGDFGEGAVAAGFYCDDWTTTGVDSVTNEKTVTR